MYDLLIDLDNTIYPEDSEIFSQIDTKMKEFISKYLNISTDEAYKLQKKYFYENGTTLRGLMLNHNVKPESFLEYVHAINVKNIKKNSKLKIALNQYKGKKIIFTNGTKKHALNILQSVGVEKCIDNIFDIKNMEYIPKPNIFAYKKVLKKYALSPENTILFDDISNNLKPAYEIKIKTVLIKKIIDRRYNKDYINYIISDLTEALTKLTNKEIFNGNK